MQMEDVKPRSRIRLWLAVIAVVLLIAIVGLSILASRISPMARERVVKLLQEKYQSQVDLKDLKISFFPRVRVTGTGLVMHYRNRTDLPPFVNIKSFSADAEIGALLGDTKRVSQLRLEGLEINIPPKSERQETPKAPKSDSGEKPMDVVV